MIKINTHYLKLQASYLFSDIAKRVAAFQEANPDRDVIKLGTRHHAYGSLGCQSAEVGAYTGLLYQCKIARHRCRLRRLGNASQAESSGNLAFMGAAVVGQPVIVGIKKNSQIEGCGILERSTLHQWVYHRLQRVTDADTPCLTQSSHFTQMLAGQ